MHPVEPIGERHPPDGRKQMIEHFVSARDGDVLRIGGLGARRLEVGISGILGEETGQIDRRALR
jgi:hypothetical protein